MSYRVRNQINRDNFYPKMQVTVSSSFSAELLGEGRECGGAGGGGRGRGETGSKSADIFTVCGFWVTGVCP